MTKVLTLWSHRLRKSHSVESETDFHPRPVMDFEVGFSTPGRGEKGQWRTPPPSDLSRTSVSDHQTGRVDPHRVSFPLRSGVE